MKEKIMKILQDDDCPLFMVFGELEKLVDYLIANSVTVETQTKQSLVYGDYIRCSEDQVPEAKELLLEQMIATIRELAKKDDFFEVSDLEDAETAERIKVSWKFSIPHMKD